MKKIKSSKIKLLVLLLPLLYEQSLAACPPPAGTLPPASSVPTPNDTFSSDIKVFNTGTYWKQCWSAVTIHTLNGEAKNQLNELKINYQQKYHTILLNKLNEASASRVSATQTNSQILIQRLNENYGYLLEAKTKMKTKMLEKELDYKKEIKEEAFNSEKQGFFSDGNGENGIIKTNTQSYDYFKNICKRNKMFNKTAGPIYQEKRNIAVNNSSLKNTKSIVEGSNGNASALAKSIISTHLNDYCSPLEIKYNQCVNPLLKLCTDGDLDSGVCKVDDGSVFELTNSDTNAVNFLNPRGFDGKYKPDGTELEQPRNEIKDELFKVKYTYDEGQEKAAKSFAQNLIFSPGIITPAVNDKANRSKSNYITAYNSYIANLNLANYSFLNAIEARKAITKGEIKMSERDVLRYIIHSLQDPDANSATLASKTKGKELMLYQLMTVNNKLKVLEYEQKERMESLLGALVSNKVNSPSLLNKLNELKK